MKGFLGAFKPPSPQSKNQIQQIQDFEQFAVGLDFRAMNFEAFQKFYATVTAPFNEWKKYVEEKQKQQVILEKIQKMQEQGIDVDSMLQDASEKK